MSEHRKGTRISWETELRGKYRNAGYGGSYVSKHQMGPEIAERSREKRDSRWPLVISVIDRTTTVFTVPANPIFTSPIPQTPSMHFPNKNNMHTTSNHAGPISNYARPTATTSSQISPPLTQRPSGTPRSPARLEPVSSGCHPTRKYPPPRSRPPQTPTTDS